MQRYLAQPRVDPADALAREIKAHQATKNQLQQARNDLAAERAKDTAEPATAVVFSDREEQFEHELWLSWLHTTPECDRDDWPLRPYQLGPEFLDSLDALEAISRPRLIRTCVDVVTGRYAEINGRQAKRLHDGTPTSGRGAPDLVRHSDGAIAWRCAVQTKGVGARMLWWELPGHEPELARLAGHNDFRIV